MTVLQVSHLILLHSLSKRVRKGELEGKGIRIKHIKSIHNTEWTKLTRKTLPKIINPSILHFKLGFAAHVKAGLLWAGAPSTAPMQRSEHYSTLSLQAAWLCVNTGKEFPRNHPKRWQGYSQSGFYVFPIFNFPAVRFHSDFFPPLSQLTLRRWGAQHHCSLVVLDFYYCWKDLGW